MLTDLYLDDTQNLIIENIQKDLIPFVYKKYNFKEFKKDFTKEGSCDTPLFRASLNLKGQFYKLANWKENRKKLVGLIKPNLSNPLMIFVDKDNSYKFLSFFDKNGRNLFIKSLSRKPRSLRQG